MPMIRREVPADEQRELKGECRIRVLVIDDHPVTRFGIAAIIEATPDMTVVAQAGSGEEAVVGDLPVNGVFESADPIHRNKLSQSTGDSASRNEVPRSPCFQVDVRSSEWRARRKSDKA